MDTLKQYNFFDFTKVKGKKFFERQNPLWTTLINLSEKLRNEKLGNIEINVPSNVTLVNPELISIGKDTIIEPGAYIKGPCIIGNNCEIRHCAYIRGDVITGDNCVIGHCTEIKHSILLNHVCASHFAYIGDSILGNNVNLGAGVRCANFRIDKKNIKLLINGKIINTELNKLGAIVGDNVQIGCNTVMNPGTIIGKDTVAYANLNFGGYIPSNSIVKSSTKIVIKTLKKKEKRNALTDAIEKTRS